MKRLISATFLMLALTPAFAYSDIVMNIWDDGTNLYMSATGAYDLTNAPVIGSNSLGANAAVAPTYPIFGWETGPANIYAAAYSGVLSGTSDAFPASSTSTTNPFVFAESVGGILMGGGLTGSVNEFATFNGVTLASLGMVAGETVTVSWGDGGVNERGAIKTLATVPEPGSSLIFGSLGLAGLVCKRRRKVCTVIRRDPS